MSRKMGRTKNSTDDMINGALAQQQDWHERRQSFARDFLTSLNMFAKPNPNRRVVGRPAVKSDEKAPDSRNKNRTVLREYWFPILCAFVVIFVTIWVLFHHIGANSSAQPVPEPIVRTVASELKTPAFDIVRIGNDGKIVIAGRWKPDTRVSVYTNKKLVATLITDDNGEFVYAPTRAWAAGNYTVYLMDVATHTKSEDKVFLYISDAGMENSVSLLMTRDGSRVLQAPTMLRDGDLSVSKIDYMDNGRMVITGDGLPRLRVSVMLNDEVLGTARISDYKHFGLGADVGDLTPGDEYTLSVRMHDGDGNIISTITHKFIMPQMTGDDDTYYTVRRGDCLWIIARNFMRRGILFSMIAARNNIENPDLIFPKQKLNIPVKQ
ncbi:MAG: LysM peptidoglycan-binding domain-containing protein [Alphaproteobacteria bacterium]|nr:LysM peptidoglycan-binding domain-containing protein [Alphaproteobacteria bacterium]